MVDYDNYWEWSNTTYCNYRCKTVSSIEPFGLDTKWIENEEKGKKKLKPYTFLNKKERKLKIFRESIYKKKTKITKKVI
jgi:hypothetical protein